MTAKEPVHVYRIEGLDCPDCAANLEKAVQRLPSVAEARLIYTTGRLTVAPSDGVDPGPAIQQVATAMGYSAHESAGGIRCPPAGRAGVGR
jgi:Cd2+/Zn2+-exporting ATPase